MWGSFLMSAFNPRSFTNPDRLRSISPEHLLSFFVRWSDYFSRRGLDLTIVSAKDFPYERLANILLEPDQTVPDSMVNALFYVHETANAQSMDELLDRAKLAGIADEIGRAPSPADVALQIWLRRPDLLELQHAESVAFDRSNFMYFAGSRARKNAGGLLVISDVHSKEMQDRMDNWFEEKRRGRKCRIFVFPRGEKIWILVRHGMPMRREGKHQDDGESGIAFYRPQQHDVLIYDNETDEIAVNAGTKGERSLYLQTLGKVLFGKADYFDASKRYSLGPLRELGPASMAHADIAQITGVRLVEFGRRWPGKVSEMETRKCDDLFKAYGDNWEKRLAGGSFTHATFKFAFEGSKRERSVTIRPSNIARYDREADEEVIEAWLKLRGFWEIVVGADDDADEVLEIA